jgi:molybdopterin molybdotransferase
MNAPRAERPLLSLDEVLAKLVDGASPLAITQTETLPTFDALGRVLARDVVAALDVPPADNTSMDGYALRTADVPQAGVVLPVGQRIAAGVVGTALLPGTAARIFTGAQVPAGADAVVMQEACEAVAAAKTCGRAPSCCRAAAASRRRPWGWRLRSVRLRWRWCAGPAWRSSPPATS